MEHIQQIWGQALMTVCLSSLAVLLLGVVVSKTCQSFASVWKRTRSIALVGLAVGSIIYGGSKSAISPSKTSTDTDIDLYDISLNVSNDVVEVSAGVMETNFVAAILTIKVSSDSVAPYPIHFRDNNYQVWTNLASIATWTPSTGPELQLAPISGNGTNVYVWTSTDWTNDYNHSQWYIGENLPAVQVDVVDTDYIMLDEFNMTSKKVWIKFHLSDELVSQINSESTVGEPVVEIQRKIENGSWETVETLPISASTYTWNGFGVNKRTVWRLHIAVTQE